MCSASPRTVFLWPLAAPSLIAVLERLASCFEQTGNPGYVWIVGKCIDQFGREGNMATSAALQGALERVTSKVVQLMDNTMPPRWAMCWTTISIPA